MKRLIAFVLFLTGFVFFVCRADGSTRLAVGSFGLPAPTDRDLANLIVVNLSQVPQLQLVEREELNRALDETALNLNGLGKIKETVRVGALVRADQFLLGTFVPVNGTNQLIVRLVDAQSGAIRSINVFRRATSLNVTAGEIVAFVRSELERPAQVPREYLAVGTIQNLGVNNRFPDFPAQMRGSIATKLSTTATVLERDVIAFLANEVRLNQVGLTEPANGEEKHIQFAFWIIDGFYQSYEVAKPLVQVNLRIERVGGRQKSIGLQGEPNESFFANICETINREIKDPNAITNVLSATRQAEIAALEARGAQLVDYWVQNETYTLRLRTSSNPDKIMNTLDEATRVYESILLLDPDNTSARMRLAACLLFLPERWGGTPRDHLAERKARAEELYRDVILSRNNQFMAEAQVCLAQSVGGLVGLDMLRRFLHETSDPKAKEKLRSDADIMLWNVQYEFPLEQVLPAMQDRLFDELTDLEKSTNKFFTLSFEQVLFVYRLNPQRREQAMNNLLPKLLDKSPQLRPYILLAAASEQLETNSPVITSFLASLKECEEHPETLLHAPSYFAHLSTTLEDENAAHSGWIYARVYERSFEHGQYPAVIAMALARQRAAEKGLAPPLTDTGKRRLADSYAATKEWQKAYDIYLALPDVPVQTLNECRKHLNLVLGSEDVPESAWKGKSDMQKIELAYDCINRKQWLTAAAILDSIRHRTVHADWGGAWGKAFAPVLPAVVANECRVKAGKPPLKNPMLFDLGEAPYLQFTRDGPRFFDFAIEGDDIWIAIYSQIKRFSGPGPFAALKPTKFYEMKRTTDSVATSICLGSEFIWAGTEDDGLYELNRKTGQVRRFTMQDGLLLNGISGLHLQGDTLWIAYVSKGEKASASGGTRNGGVGTLNLKTRQFRSFSAALRPEAGATSQSFFNQNHLEQLDGPPQLPVIALAEGTLGEMWFAIPGKGVQACSTNGLWKTIATDGELSDIAVDSARGKLLAANHERRSGATSSEGGLMVCDSRNYYKTGRLLTEQELPSNEVSSVTTDGKVTWVGGRGFVAVLDADTQKVLRIAYLSANCIKKIQLDKKYAWVHVAAGGPGTYPDFYPEFAGTAWTGVYRVDRTAVESVPK